MAIQFGYFSQIAAWCTEHHSIPESDEQKYEINIMI